MSSLASPESEDKQYNHSCNPQPSSALFLKQLFFFSVKEEEAKKERNRPHAGSWHNQLQLHLVFLF